MTKTYNWIHCPGCKSHRIAVDRVAGDTKRLKIDCNECGEVTNVTP